MNIPSLRSTTRTLCASVLLAATVMAHGQPVFIPDVNLRAWFNSHSAGCVDADGWFDPSDPGIQQDTMFILGIAWLDADLTGIGALPNARVLIIGAADYNLPTNIPAWPDSVRRLRLEEFSAIELPEFPFTLHTLELDQVQAPFLPPLPDGCRQAHIDRLSVATALPAWPSTLSQLSIQYSQTITTLPEFPPSLRSLSLINLTGLENLPPLPADLEQVWLEGSELVGVWPDLPPAVRELRIMEMPNLTGVFPDLPAACTTLVIGGMPLVTEMGSFGPMLQTWSSYGMEGITSIPSSFPTSLGSLTLVGMPQLTCLPWLHDNMTIYLFGTGITCLPNLPANGFSIVPSTFLNAPCSILGLECIPPVITGTTYRDLNGNGVWDGGEPVLPYSPVTVQPTGGLVFSDAQGFFRTAHPPGSYTLSALPLPYTLTIAPNEHTAVLLSPADRDSLNDFGHVLLDNMQDLRIDLAFGQAVSGFEFNAWMTVRNVGTVPVDADATMSLGAGNEFVESDVAPSIIDGQDITWSFGMLQPGEQRLVIALLLVPPDTPFGTIALNTAMVFPVIGDVVPDDNTASFELLILGAFDPNNKLVSPAVLSPADLAASKPLTYTIRFQNTGNYPATRVVISDTLSADLVHGSFELMSSSHELTGLSIENGVLLFTYDGIMLPDSTNDEPNSHGFVRFRMLAQPGLPLHHEIHNIANIYFDFNAPVITEPAVVVIAEPLGIAALDRNRPLLFPVPAVDVLQVRWPASGPVDWSIHDTSGRISASGRTGGDRFAVDVSQLSAGTYLLRMVTSEGVQVARFVRSGGA